MSVAVYRFLMQATQMAIPSDLVSVRFALVARRESHKHVTIEINTRGNGTGWHTLYVPGYRSHCTGALHHFHASSRGHFPERSRFVIRARQQPLPRRVDRQTRAVGTGRCASDCVQPCGSCACVKAASHCSRHRMMSTVLSQHSNACAQICF